MSRWKRLLLAAPRGARAHAPSRPRPSCLHRLRDERLFCSALRCGQASGRHFTS